MSKARRGHFTLNVLPWEIRLEYNAGENLLNVLNRGGIYFKNTCDKTGTCGGCKVDLCFEESNTFREALACRTGLHRDAEVRILPKKIMED